jgi:AAA+ superfamily predicted ATPase
MSTLKQENLKRICYVDNRLITLDEDGVFDVWIRDELGDVVFDRQNYSFDQSIMPSKLFEILKRNVKRHEDVAS